MGFVIEESVKVPEISEALGKVTEWDEYEPIPNSSGMYTVMADVCYFAFVDRASVMVTSVVAPRRCDVCVM